MSKLRMGLVGGLVAVACLLLAATALADGIGNSGDDLRTGWYPDEASLTPQIVSSSSTFGQLWSASVDGQVYAQPLLSPTGTLIVATENDKVYGLDPATGRQQWMTSLGTPWNPADLDPNCLDIAPSVGTTATPVIDPSTNTVYLTYKSYDQSGNAAWYMGALDVTDGHELKGWPVELTTGAGGYADNGPITFFPKSQQQRPGLLLMNGVVYAGFGSHCDDPPWQGWVFGVSTTSSPPKITAKWVDNTSTTNGAGTWQAGTGLTSDRPGSILFATGNGGAFPSGPTPGSSPPSSLGESVIRLHVNTDGTLQPTDFFMAYNAAQLDLSDGDLGSGAVVGLPDQYFGTPAVPHLAVAAGKEGRVYLLNLDHLGGFQEGPNQTDDVVQMVPPRGSVYGRAGVWPGDGGYVYMPTTGGEGGTTGPLDVYKYGVTGSGMPSLSLVSQPSPSNAFAWGSGSPVITSNGTTSGSALVWIIYAADRKGDGGELRAYDPVPVDGQLNLRFSAPIGHATGYSTPGVGAGRLYVGTRDGTVLAFGPTPGHMQISSAALDFGAVQVGSSTGRTFTIANTGGTTITIITSGPPVGGEFTAGTTLPAGTTIKPGQTLTESVTFTPTSPGPASGSWQITSDDGSGAQQVNFTGTGTTVPVVSPPARVRKPAAPRFVPAVVTTRKLRRVHITYRAAVAGVSRFVLKRAKVGRRGPHGCVAVTRRNHARARCTRYVVVRFFRHRGHVGINKLWLGTYVRLRKLAVGRYRLESILLDSAGGKHRFHTTLRIIAAKRRHHVRRSAKTVISSFEDLLLRLPFLL